MSATDHVEACKDCAFACAHGCARAEPSQPHPEHVAALVLDQVEPKPPLSVTITWKRITPNGVERLAAVRLR